MSIRMVMSLALAWPRLMMKLACTLGDAGVSHTGVFQPQFVNQLACGDFLRVFEDAAGAGAGGLGQPAFGAGVFQFFFNFLPGAGAAFKDGLQHEVVGQVRNGAVLGVEVAGGVAADFPVFIQAGDGDEVPDHVPSHGSGVHAEASAHVAGDSVHPFQAAEAAAETAETIFFRRTPAPAVMKLSRTSSVPNSPPEGMDDGAAQAAVAHDDVGAAAYDVDRDVSVPAVVDGRLHGGEGGGLQPELGAAAHAHGGMAGHGLIQRSVQGFSRRAFQVLQQGEVPGDAHAAFVDVARPQRQEEVAGFQALPMAWWAVLRSGR